VQEMKRKEEVENKKCVSIDASRIGDYELTK